jgi:hypothetical protein
VATSQTTAILKRKIAVKLWYACNWQRKGKIGEILWLRCWDSEVMKQAMYWSLTEHLFATESRYYAADLVTTCRVLHLTCFAKYLLWKICYYAEEGNTVYLISIIIAVYDCSDILLRTCDMQLVISIISLIDMYRTVTPCDFRTIINTERPGWGFIRESICKRWFVYGF